MFNPFETRKFTIPQIEEMLSAENRYYAAETLGHEPSVRELIIHWATHTVAYKVAHFVVDPNVPTDAFFFPDQKPEESESEDPMFL